VTKPKGNYIVKERIAVDHHGFGFPGF
jgi:hypothetical protein